MREEINEVKLLDKYADKSIKFSDILKENGILRFEDVMEEVRVKFDSKFLKSED